MNPWEEKKRFKKVHAVAEYIDCRACEDKLNPHDKDLAARIVEQLTSATDEQWADIEEKAHQNHLSSESRAAVIAIYRKRAGLPEAAPAAAGPQLCRNGDGRPAAGGDAYCMQCQVADIIEGRAEELKASAAGAYDHPVRQRKRGA